MVPELGHFALLLSLAVALVQSTVPLWGAATLDRRLMRVAPAAALTQFILVGAAYAALTYAYLGSDFSVANVLENSHTQKPLLFKLSGVWGNHEGSMLLWALILALFGALVCVAGKEIPERLRVTALAVQAWISCAFLTFIIATSNPFLRVAQPPAEGSDLNPALQDIGLAIHPPLLYLGYVGFSIVFSFAIAALLSARVDTQWARVVRPWILTAWSFLTLGIAMGSYWAYYTLGWGGFWFWDPVENASLMPWLAGTALMHSAVVMERRGALKIWTIFLAILTFCLSLLGTFLVRSGILTSVHAFANDPQRGVFILAILCILIGGSFALFAWRAPAMQQGGLFAPVSREGAIVLNNLLLSTSCATVFVGTLYPLALEAVTGEKISVGPPFFNATFVPLFVLVLICLPIGQSLAWKRGDLFGVAQRLTVAAAIGLCGGLLIFALRGGPALSAAMSGLALFVILGAFADIATRVFRSGAGLDHLSGRIRSLTFATWGAALAHAGLGVGLLGLASSGWGVERITAMRAGEVLSLGPYELRLEGVTPLTKDNYQANFARFEIRAGGAMLSDVEAARKTYPARGTTTTEAGLKTLGFGQVYVVVTDQHDGAIDVRAYWKPLITLVWIGALIMAAGAGLSLLGKRQPVPSRKAIRAQAAAGP